MFRGSRCLLAILAGVMVLLLCRQSASAAVPRQPGGQDDLPPQEIYEQLSPAIVQLTTEWGSGSGVLFERRGQKYVVTNHHVLWPYPYADVVFPDGLELFDVPVVDWDVMVDVAVLGPVDVDIPAANISARREVAVGDTAYFIGYPSEWEQFAQPTLSQGIVSRTRDWPTAGASYYQVDAEIAGGQSGGAMVAADGNVVGLTTFFVADDGSFGLALSAEALLRRIDGILRGSDVDKLGERFVLLDDVDDGTEIRLNSHRLGAQDFSGDMDIYFVTLREGQVVNVWVEAMGYDPLLAIGPADGHEGELTFEEYSDLNIFGLVGDLVYEVPADGKYLIVLSDSVVSASGYYIGVDDITEEMLTDEDE